MNNNREYLKGAKRLQIINRWLRGLEDPEYEVYPTRKEGKYIIKKRKKALEQTENENEQIPNEESDNEDKEGSNEDKEEDKEEEKEDEYKDKDDSIDKDKNKDNIEVDDNKNRDREDNIEDPLNPLFKARLQTKFDPLYINLQILSELQQVNEYLRREMERKDRNELLKSLVDEAMNQMYKNKEDKKDESDEDESSEEEVYHYYHQPYVRKNTIFADIKR